MYTNPTLATRFAGSTRVIRADIPLTEDQMRAAAPSVFAEGKHASRSERYTYIPTIDVLRGLRKEGFDPFMVAQSHSRIAGKTEFTKHMVRMRHRRDDEREARANGEAREIILINSHDGASAYQMLAGMMRFVCCNGLVVGDTIADIRLPHKGDVQYDVIEGATRILDDFDGVDCAVMGMKSTQLNPQEQTALATAALTLRFGDRADSEPPAPITAEQLNEARRPEDLGSSLWATFQRLQENSTKGGQVGRNSQGRRVRTRAVGSIDRTIGLNRALWVLAEEMRQIKAAQ